MNQVPIVKIVDRKTMMERLCEVSDDDRLVAEFYPKLTMLAEEFVKPEDTIRHILTAICEYTASLEPEDGQMPKACTQLPFLADRFFDAMIDPAFCVSAATTKERS